MLWDFHDCLLVVSYLSKLLVPSFNIRLLHVNERGEQEVRGEGSADAIELISVADRMLVVELHVVE